MCVVARAPRDFAARRKDSQSSFDLVAVVAVCRQPDFLRSGRNPALTSSCLLITDFRDRQEGDVEEVAYARHFDDRWLPAKSKYEGALREKFFAF